MDTYILGISNNKKLELEKQSLEQKLAKVEGKKRKSLKYISNFKNSLKLVIARNDKLDKKLAIMKETMDRQAQEHETI